MVLNEACRLWDVGCGSLPLWGWECACSWLVLLSVMVGWWCVWGGGFCVCVLTLCGVYSTQLEGAAMVPPMQPAGLHPWWPIGLPWVCWCVGGWWVVLQQGKVQV